MVVSNDGRWHGNVSLTLAVREQRDAVSGRVEGQLDNRRSAMKLLPSCPILWSSLLCLWIAQCETEYNNSHMCPESSEEVHMQFSNKTNEVMERDEVEESFVCLLYPTNKLNCSWSFLTIEEDTQLSVVISVCLHDKINQTTNLASVKRVESVSMFLPGHEFLKVVLHFNMSRYDGWTTYTHAYEMEKLEVLAPPSNITVSLQNGNLNVTWKSPHSLTVSNNQCFEYQLDMGDQDTPKLLMRGQESYTELNADPARIYIVRMRTRISENCYGSPGWSEWSSPVISVGASAWRLNYLVIISISFGIPMILLAVLLLVRHQRVSEVLFPPIPRPPQKYKNFLEKSDPTFFFYPVPPSKPEEEITEVEEQNLGKMS